MWNAVSEIDAVLAANDRLRPGPAARRQRRSVTRFPGHAERPVRRRRHQSSATAVTASGWNFAEAFETHRRPHPRRPRAQCTTAPSPRGASSTAAPTARRHAARPRLRRAGQGGAVPLQRPRVPRDRCSPRSRPGWPSVNTNYRYAADELVYLWDNADVVAVVFHGAFADAVRGASAPRLPGIAHVAVGRRRQRPVPRLGDRLRRRRRDRRRAGRTSAPWGRSRRPPAAALHRRHHRHAQGRDVAPGRPVPARSLQTAGKPTPPGQDLDGFAGTIAKPGPAQPARPRRSCTAPGCSTPSPRCCIGGGDRHHQRPPLRRRVELLDTIERARVEVDDDRRRRLRQADPAGARRRAGALGPLVAARSCSSSGVMWSQETKDGLLPPQHRT